mmetsp:Transcript_18135/g.52845  ORF Transcript_18135/g.52845 Transcript_18135/m.52845 type:complete len:472 (-) Transcript_18135:124-1539(-)
MPAAAGCCPSRQAAAQGLRSRAVAAARSASSPGDRCLQSGELCLAARLAAWRAVGTPAWLPEAPSPGVPVLRAPELRVPKARARTGARHGPDAPVPSNLGPGRRTPTNSAGASARVRFPRGLPPPPAAGPGPRERLPRHNEVVAEEAFHTPPDMPWPRRPEALRSFSPAPRGQATARGALPGRREEGCWVPEFAAGEPPRTSGQLPGAGHHSARDMPAPADPQSPIMRTSIETTGLASITATFPLPQPAAHASSPPTAAPQAPAHATPTLAYVFCLQPPVPGPPPAPTALPAPPAELQANARSATDGPPRQAPPLAAPAPEARTAANVRAPAGAQDEPVARGKAFSGRPYRLDEAAPAPAAPPGPDPGRPGPEPGQSPRGRGLAPELQRWLPGAPPGPEGVLEALARGIGVADAAHRMSLGPPRSPGAAAEPDLDEADGVRTVLFDSLMRADNAHRADQHRSKAGALPSYL